MRQYREMGTDIQCSNETVQRDEDGYSVVTRQYRETGTDTQCSNETVQRDGDGYTV